MSWAEESGGLPQLKVETYTSQLFWLVVFFIAVYTFMRFVGIPRVVAIMEERRAQVGGDIGAAEKLRLQADEARIAYEATMAEAHAGARRMLVETHERNVAALAERTSEASVGFERQVDQAIRGIEAAQTNALRSIRDVAVGLAADITAKLAGHAPAADRVAHAVDEAAGRGAG
jgi:F-type H+-transporting ATPase subunit b